MLEFPSLVDVLRWQAAQHPERPAFTFLRNDNVVASQVTYQELDRRARAYAVSLQRLNAANQRALLLIPPGIDYVAALMGCLYASTVAVPAYPPQLNRPMPRIEAIVKDAQATVVLAPSQILENIQKRLDDLPGFAGLDWLSTDLDTSLADAWQAPRVDRPYLAYLQYTSGSTAAPKGVMMSHGNVLYTLADLAAVGGQTQDSVMVTWLPPFHDMGLVFGILYPLYAGFHCVMMAPAAFVQHPLRWLQAISDYRATHSAAPNFAFDLCVDKIAPEDRENLDLSSWTLVLNGAEPVRQETLERFYHAFAANGLRPTTVVPGYGLAEATLQVTAIRANSHPIILHVDAAALEQNQAVERAANQPGARSLVGYAPSVLETKLRIVEPETRRECPPGVVGEIWVAGPGVAQGYWMQPDATAETFGAYLADTGEGPFLRTGDLGFMLDGKFYVTGRAKDVIIIRGRNHYPQDIERTVEQSHPALHPGNGAAFSVDVDGEERLVIVYELKRTQRNADVDEVVSSIRRQVAVEHELDVYAVSLLRPASVPKTSSGKIQRRLCRAQFLQGELTTIAQWVAPQAAPVNERPPSPAGKSASEITTWLVNQLAARLWVSPGRIDIHAPVAEHGLSSMVGVQITGELADWLGRELPPTLFYEYVSIAEVARHLAADRGPAAEPSSSPAALSARRAEEPIAIIGLGCRFPGAANPEAFWQLLRNGVHAVKEVPEDRWDRDLFYSPDPADPGKMNTRWGGFLDHVDRFDPLFFGISPREAARMDPQQRLLLEVAWEALEDAGQVVDQLTGEPVGVFVGLSSFDYAQLQLAQTDLGDPYAGTGSALSIAANRLSYLFNFHGPSLVVDTACSSSLVAVHLACQSLRNGECNMALVGGANLLLSPTMSVNFTKAGFLAPDGRCKAFDARADGYVRSEGAGMVVLKPLSQARADGDPIYAVIRGSAINQDGRTNGLTAPNPLAQQAVLRAAYAQAGIQPGLVQYIETHGTGTALGDPIEASALGAVLATGRPAGQHCAIGSVKSNIGHLEAAAGVAGLIKVALALKHSELPPSLHFQTPNPLIPFDDLPVRVQQHLTPWPRHDHAPALAGVSSFGFGGTNAHVVLQEAPPVEGNAQRQTPAEYQAVLLPLSARSPNALRDLARAYDAFLQDHASTSLADIAYSAGARRSHHRHRLAVVGESHEEIRRKLGSFLQGEAGPGIHSGTVAASRRPIVFVFPGQGSQWVGMGRQLLAESPVFRAAIEACSHAMAPYQDWSLLEALSTGESESELDQIDRVQPLLFAVQVGLAALWRAWGVEPEAVVGHSMGEVAAAYVAGALSLSDAARIICCRSQLLRQISGQGAMVAVELSLAEAMEAIDGFSDQVSVAVNNGPRATVLAGDREALKTLVGRLEAQEVFCRWIQVDVAAHSPQVAPLRGELQQTLAGITPEPATVPIYSTVTGERINGDQLDVTYWVRNLREPVLFASAVERLVQDRYGTFVEISPHPTLLSAIDQSVRQLGGEAARIPSLRRGEAELATLLDSLGMLYTLGEEVNWRGLDPEDRQYVALPSYPWQRERFWLSNLPASQPPAARPPQQALWPVALAAGRQQAQQGPLDLPLHIWPDRSRCLDSLTTAYVIRALRDLGAFQKPGERHTVAALRDQCQILPLYDRLVRRWLERLVAAGFLHREGEIYACPAPLPDMPVDPLLKEAESVCAAAPLLPVYLQRCGEALPALVQGTVDPLTLLFPQGSFEIAESLYQNSPEARYFNHIAAAVVASVVGHRPERPARLLEIGAGSGGTAAHVLQALPSDRTRYFFTDLSDFFFIKAREKFKEYPFIRYAVLDIEQDPQAQGFEPASFDVIIAANVLHATRQLDETLAHVRSMLAPGGVLVLWEVTQHQSWFDISFGLIRGWHRHDDPHRQDDTPLLSAQAWNTVLHANGFEQVIALPESRSAADVLGQHIVVAHTPAAADTLPWSAEISETPSAEIPQAANGHSAPQHQIAPRRIQDAATEEERQTLLEGYLRDQIAQVLQLAPEQIDRETPLDALGLDSLVAIELTNRLQAGLGISFPTTLIWKSPTIAALAPNLAQTLPATSVSQLPAPEPDIIPAGGEVKWTSLVPIQPKGSRPPLFLVPPSASTIVAFRELARKLGPDQPLYGLQPLGMDGKHPPHDTVEAMAAHYIREIQQVVPDGPYYLGGRCFGGIVAFEMAQQLQAQGKRVPFLAILDVLVPPNTQLALFSPLRRSLIADEGRWPLFEYPRQLFWLSMHHLFRYVRLLYWFRENQEENQSLMQMGSQAQYILQTENAHAKARDHYQPRVYPGRITIFANDEVRGGLQLHWARLTSAGVDIEVVPGSHLNMFREPYVSALAARMQERLRMAAEQADDHALASANGQPSLTAPSRPHAPARPSNAGGFIPSRDALESQLAAICEQLWGVQPIGADTNLLDLPGNPLLFVYLHSAIRRELDAVIPMPALLQAPSIAQLANLLRQGAIPASTTALVALQPGGTKRPFFCVPSHSTAASLAGLARHLGPEQPVYAFEPLGLDGTHRPQDSVEAMAALYVQEMKAVQPDGPYLLGGRGFGGIIAFEMAQSLWRQGDRVALLAVLDTLIPPNATHEVWYAPGLLGQSSGKRALSWLRRLAYNWQRSLFRFREPRAALGHLPLRHRARYRRDPVTRAIYETNLAHFHARLRYVPQVYPGRIILFSNADNAGNHQIRWASLTEQGIAIEVIPGNRHTIFCEPNLAQLAQALHTHLEKAQAEDPPVYERSASAHRDRPREAV